jgi:hypothetical protein
LHNFLFQKFGGSRRKWRRRKMKNKNKIIFGAVLSAFILLTTPVIANVVYNRMSKKSELINYNVEDEQILEDSESIKELLFKTIIDFTQNDDFLSLIKKNGFNFEFENNDLKDICKKLLLKNPRTILSLFRFKPTVSEDYLRYLHNQGVEILKLLDEYEIKSISEFIDTNDEDIKDGITNIIISNTELRNDIDGLNDINCYYYDIDNFDEIPGPTGPPIICFILTLIVLPFSLYYLFIYSLTNGLIIPPVAYLICIIISYIRFILNCS